MKKTAFIKGRPGQGIVEFALIVPILFLLVFGIVDLGRLAYYQSILHQAAKEGARMASVGSSISAVAGRMKNLAYPLIGNVSTDTSAGTDDQGNACTEITFVPLSGHTMTAYLTPPYSSSLATGSKLRVLLTYRMDYVTPLAAIFGNTEGLKAVYYTRTEVPPI